MIHDGTPRAIAAERILMRSAAADVDFIPADIRRFLRFHPEATSPLHAVDRVGTYGSLHLAEVR
jgi:S-adenosylmethionine-diacylglycerol 3-amino-3-carboxypropyl transferase